MTRIDAASMMLTVAMVCLGLIVLRGGATYCVLRLALNKTSLVQIHLTDSLGRADSPESTDSPAKSQDDYAARMFQMFFGGSEMYGAPALHSGLRRGRDVHHAHRVSLEDLYCGRTSHVAVQKSVICNACLGFGGKAVCWSRVFCWCFSLDNIMIIVLNYEEIL